MVLQPKKSLQKTTSQSVELLQTEALKAAESQKIVAITVEKIRQSLDLEYIFQTTTQEIRQLLNSDRVILYRFNPDWSGTFVAESLAQGWLPLIQQQVHQPELVENVSECSLKNLSIPPIVDTYLQDTQGGRFSKNETYRVCHDVYSANFSKCYLKILEQCQARAYVITAIYQSQQLWGLLAVYQNDGPREWQANEVYILTQIASQLGVALQQAELLKQTQSQKEELAATLKDLQQAQAQLIQSEKMVSLGQLVAGIAHEINNPINFIYANISYVDKYAEDLLELLHLYQEQHPSPTPKIQKQSIAMDIDYIAQDLPKTLNSMMVGANRIHQLVLSLRTFSRLDNAGIKTIDIHESIDSTLVILQHRLTNNGDTPNIKLIKEYGHLPLLNCYPAELNQVFMNLLSNAIDALETSSVNHPQIRIQTKVTADNTILISIADNGNGIEKNLQSRIFDPFFTTKEPGKGTGLGLSISYQIIVKKHAGQIKCFSELGQGSEFQIEIPLNSLVTS
ncbi:MAG: ATP-binding protein [Nostoc sp.]